MKFFDRLLTIVITATLTSMIWIVFGSTLIDAAEEEEPAEAASDPAATIPSVTQTATPSATEAASVPSTPALVPPAPTPSASTSASGTPSFDETPEPSSPGNRG